MSAVSDPIQRSCWRQATELFGPFSHAERRLFKKLASLGEQDFIAGEAHDDPITPNEVLDDDRVRGELLSWVLSGQSCQEELRSLGRLQVSGEKITGNLRVEDVRVPFAIVFESCQFEETIHFERSQIAYLSLADSTCKGLAANGLRVETDIILNGMHVEGGLQRVRKNDQGTGSESFAIGLDDVRVGGVIDCRSALFDCPNGYAISFARAQIEGQLDISDTKGVGKIRLSDCQIGANLDCTNAEFLYEDDVENSSYAVDLERILIGGNCLLRGKLGRNFRVSGSITLQHAEIGGSLDCSAALIQQAEQGGSYEQISQNSDNDSARNYSFNASYAKVAGSCLFSDGFAADATISIRAAEIGGDLVCVRGDFNAREFAIDASLVHIKGGFDLRFARWDGEIMFRLGRSEALAISGFNEDGPTSRGLILQHATCKVLIAPAEAWKPIKHYDLEGFRYDSMYPTKGVTGRSVSEWIEKSHNADLPQPWEQAAEVLRKTGFATHARFVLVEKERVRAARWRGIQWFLKRPFHLTYGLLAGYGHKPEQAFFWLLMLWALGSIAVWYGDKHDAFFTAMDRVYVEAAQSRPFQIPAEYPALNAVVYSLDVLIPFLDLNQERYWLPDRTNEYGSWLQIGLWVYVVLGWIIVSFGVAAVTGLIKRQ